TDNRNRTASEIRKIFERSGGKLGSAGAVKHFFKRKGYFSISANGLDEDHVMGVALDADAEDVKLKGTSYEITCDPAHFNQVQQALTKAGLTAEVSEITQMAEVPIDIDLDTA